MHNRIAWIDRIKGLMIILVVIGHTCTSEMCYTSRIAEVTYLVINSFNMPIFFFLSGMIEWNRNSEKKIGVQILNKAKRLIIPYALYLTFVYVFFAVCSFIPMLDTLLRSGEKRTDFLLTTYLRDIIFCEGQLDKHLWFIYVLFFVSIIVVVIKRVRVSATVLTLSSLILIVLLKIKIPNIDEGSFRILYFIIYYLFFYCLGKSGFFIARNSRKILIPTTVVFVLLEAILILNFFFEKKSGYFIDILKLLIGIVSSLCLVAVFSILRKKKMKILELVGLKSFSIYLIHQPFVVSGSAAILLKIGLPVLAVMFISTLIGVTVPLFIDHVQYIFANKWGKLHGKTI